MWISDFGSVLFSLRIVFATYSNGHAFWSLLGQSQSNFSVVLLTFKNIMIKASEPDRTHCGSTQRNFHHSKLLMLCCHLIFLSFQSTERHCR